MMPRLGAPASMPQQNFNSDPMNIDLLLTPLPGNQPAGEDLSFSAAFDEIAAMRHADDPTLNQGVWLTPIKQADWAGVTSMCQSLLSNRSKDLRLALWLTEALTVTQGYAGMASGLALCTALCERHWEQLHPLPDGNDSEERIGNIAWMLQRLNELAMTVPVANGFKGERHTLQDLQRARQRQTLAERAGQPPDTLPPDQPQAITVAQFRQALQETPAEQVLSSVDALRSSHAHLHAWQRVIDARLGHDGPSFVAAREALEQALHELERLATDVGALERTESPSHGEHGQAPSPVQTDTPMTHTAEPCTAPRNRSEALQQLKSVADFFRLTEPHSPVAYLAEKAIKWGSMPLHQWLGEVVKDPSSMAHLHELLGLKAPTDQGHH